MQIPESLNKTKNEMQNEVNDTNETVTQNANEKTTVVINVAKPQ